MLRRSARSSATFKFEPRTPSIFARLIALSLAAGLSACAYGTGSQDIDRNPIANTGAGASIIYPGRGAPTFRSGGQYGPRGGVIGYGQPGESAGGGAPQAGSSGGGGGSYNRSGSGTPSNGGGNVSFLGGSEEDEVSHKSYKNEPGIVKVLALPFAIAAAPFKAAYDAARGKPEPGPEIPRTTQTSRLPEATSSERPTYDSGQSPQTYNGTPVRNQGPQTYDPVTSQPRDYESVLLDKMERELEQREALRPTSGHRGSRTASPVVSIADELATLQRTAPAPRTAAVPLVTPPQNPQYAGLQTLGRGLYEGVPMQTSRAPGESPFAELALHDAHGIVDRNGDGRIDHWLFRENGRLVREVLDDNFDGQGERTIHYDIASNQVTRIEEDFNHDAVIDSWTNYRDGRVIRRRSDVDHDGAVDSWTYYRDGEISRHERDTTGDGFRDRVGYYRNGTLDHEEQDHDGDGRAEVTVRYDANEQIVGREEDLDGDGVVDLISHFENGKLTSRELLDPSALERRTAPRR